MSPTPAGLRHRSLIASVIATGLIFSAAATWFLHRAEQRRVAASFQQKAALQAQVLREHLQLHAELVRSVRAYIEHSRETQPEEFTELVSSFATRLPSTVAVHWAPRIERAQREPFERRIQAQTPAFQIWERQQPGEIATPRIAARPRDEYCPITWLTPLEGNEMVRGFDLLAHPTTAPLLQSARRLRQMLLTPPVPILRADGSARSYGVVFIEPLFRPHDPQAAPDGFVGAVQAVFDTQLLLGSNEAHVLDDFIDLAVYDDTAKDESRLLFARIDQENSRGSLAQLAGLASRRFATEVPLQFGQRTWRVVMAPNAKWVRANQTGLPWLALGGLATLTVLAASLVGSLLSRTAKIEQLVRERTVELNDSRRLLTSLLSHLPGVAYRCDGRPPYAPLFVSRGITQLCGLSAEDMTSGRVQWQHLLHPDDAGTYRLVAQGLTSHEPFEREYRLRHTDGSWRWVWERGRGIYDQAGQLISIEGLIVDATDRKAAEDRTREFDRQLLETQKLESLGVLAGGIAHDFNNILTAILGNAALARLDLPSDSPLRPQLEQIEISSRRAADLCTKLLAYAGRGSLAKNPVNLSQLLQDTLPLLEVSVSKTTRLHLTNAPDLPLIDGDATQLRQTMLNLVLNAAEAIGQKAGEIQLVTFTKTYTSDELRQAVEQPSLPSGSYVGLEVRDTGGGIPPELIGRIFEPFFTTKFSGRGLGLSAVLGIVRSHRGAIFVESRPAEGASLRVLFPALPTELAPLPASPQPDPSSSLELPRLEGTVLIVDDEDSVRETAARTLRTAGLDVIEATHGFKALELCREHPEIIDLILLDLTMPGLSGEETLRRLRQQGTTQKVILMSGYTASEATQRCQQLGAVAFIPKPFEIATLARLVATHLRR